MAHCSVCAATTEKERQRRTEPEAPAESRRQCGDGGTQGLVDVGAKL